MIPKAAAGVARINGQTEGFSVALNSSGPSSYAFSRTAAEGIFVGSPAVVST